MRKAAKNIDDIKDLDYLSLPELALVTGINYISLKSYASQLPKLDGTRMYNKKRSLEILENLARSDKQK